MVIPALATRRRRGLTISFIVLAGSSLLVLLVLVSPFRGEGPWVDGQPLSHWVEELSAAPTDETVRVRRAKFALQALGTNALPYLESLCLESSKRWEVYLAHYLSEHPFGQKLLRRAGLEPIYARRSKAAKAFVALGSLGLPALMTFFRSPDPELRNFAMATITAIGPEADMIVSAFLKVLNDSHAEIREGGVSMLGDPAFQTPAVTLALLRILTNDPVDFVRQSAARSLAKHGSASTVAIPFLLESLRDRAIRLWAAHALGRIGVHARDQVVPALRQLREDSDAEIRSIAEIALQELEGSRAVP